MPFANRIGISINLYGVLIMASNFELSRFEPNGVGVAKTALHLRKSQIKAKCQFGISRALLTHL